MDVLSGTCTKADMAKMSSCFEGENSKQSSFAHLDSYAVVDRSLELCREKAQSLGRRDAEVRISLRSWILRTQRSGVHSFPIDDSPSQTRSGLNVPDSYTFPMNILKHADRRGVSSLSLGLLAASPPYC